MQAKDTNSQITSAPSTAPQGMQSSSGTQGTQTQTMGQAAQNQATAVMPGVQKVKQQVDDLRQTLQDLMMNQQYADGEIVLASADLDQQLQSYSRMLNDKKQPSMRTF